MGIPKQTRSYELNKDEAMTIANALLSTQEAKLVEATIIGNMQRKIASEIIESWKSNTQKAGEMEPRQPVMKQRQPVQEEQEEQEEVSSEGYEEQ